MKFDVYGTDSVTLMRYCGDVWERVLTQWASCVTEKGKRMLDYWSRRYSNLLDNIDLEWDESKLHTLGSNC